ncbi:hypothetical protein ASPZODRAFT_88977 [Penicilliopsis zonata CBS 506.65]|uniref:Kynurenine formamidase n=1 Tax=Penicilliopsis zonata CBS 506.65 TaxID=1073090 RepID=A0A1L9SQY9_9EURO|nr:hypothetical protein ASPZODRAFT_88977 [Penicilliopsis zonata CBS 506.65]OJJ49645.1 hypothetical protein ASPZODRAFT_88977 [Penicilliopsis zonata CBS 506.65]
MPQEIFSYSNDHVLQKVSVTVLSDDPQPGYWVIFIHGGAWRDPSKTFADLAAAETLLCTAEPYTSTVLPHIAAFASIEYRLSAHPEHPQDPVATPPSQFRNARHPDHLADVESALALLQGRYGFGERYVLVGHSCGATLAFQTVMRHLGGYDDHFRHRNLAQPSAILGVAGIYECRLLRDHFSGISAYQDLFEGAFGPDETLWDAVSPAKVGSGFDGIQGGWTAGKLAVLAYSAEDELVDTSQAEAMEEALRLWTSSASQEETRRTVMLPVKGRHDEIWEKGEELARAIAFTLTELQKM